MMEQMWERIPGYSGAFPIWFWYSPKPDLRNSGHLNRGERALKIELELPRELLLLSDFQAWNCILNREHLSLSWRDSREWDRKVKGHDQYHSILPEPLESELQSSWTRIFDLGLIKRSRLWAPASSIQGVVERVLLSEVRDVREFVAR
jgi:hypothetical protein